MTNPNFNLRVKEKKNGGEDDEVAAMAASSNEEIRGEACGEEAGRLGSGEGECTGEREIDGGDSLERS